MIGRDNQLPWRIAADLARFKRLTIGKPVVMGKRTFGVTRDRCHVAEGCTIAHSIEGALGAAGNVPEIAVIGGAPIFEELLPRADVLYVTVVHAAIGGDTFFPALSPHDWIERNRKEVGVGPANAYPLSFVTFRRSGCPS